MTPVELVTLCGVVAAISFFVGAVCGVLLMRDKADPHCPNCGVPKPEIYP